MLRSYKISPLSLIAVISCLMVGEIASGTSIYFVTMMAVAMLSIGLTYNLLGGLSTLSGMIFAMFALRTIVISQIAKVLLFEAADKNLEAPELTIYIYAMFYLSAFVGVLFLGKIRLRLPKPMEPTTIDQENIIYIISISIGIVSSIMYEIYSGRGNDVSYTEGRSIALALSTLLLFSMVIAVDVRMSVTNGKHSFGVAAAIPWIVATVISFSESTRTTTIAPSMIYYLICYLKGYRFRKLHYIALVLGMVVFVYIIGPLEVFSREVLSGKTLEDRVMMSFQLLATYHDPGELRDSAMQVFESAAAREQYFSRPGTYIISRLSLIRADSNIVSACSGGFHYGFEGIRIDLLQSIPTFLYKAKPRYTNGQDYIGHVIGMSSDAETNSYPQESAVGDSYGAFGWAGVILFPLFCFPCVFIVYESIFNIDRPWGIVAFGSCLLTFGELMVGRFVPLVVRTPIYLIALSYVIGTVANMIPVRGDRPRTLWRSNRTCQQDESASH